MINLSDTGPGLNIAEQDIDEQGPNVSKLSSTVSGLITAELDQLGGNVSKLSNTLAGLNTADHVQQGQYVS